MNYLFIHHNFPGQYQHLAQHLAAQPGNRVVFISQPNANRLSGVETIFYSPFRTPTAGIHHYIADLEQAIIWGQAVHEVCRGLKARGFRPDIVLGHSGWGETFFVKEVWPDVPLLAYFEFYYRISGADVGFDPHMPVTVDDPPRLRVKNAINLLAFEAADWGVTATRWQASLYPRRLRQKIVIAHEGIDTDSVAPGEASIRIAGCDRPFTRADELITFVSRNLEPYRGFHVFMRALHEILRRRPRAQVLIMGGDEVSYGPPPPAGTTFRQMMLEEVGAELDLQRVHFLGRVPYDDYLKLLRLSSAHVYLTYPFVLSWSVLEAMSCGCAVIASAVPPVTEVIEDRRNGFLVDFLDPSDLCRRLDEVLDHPDRMQVVRDAARQTIVERFDLRTVALPRHLALIEAVVSGRDPHGLLPLPSESSQRESAPRRGPTAASGAAVKQLAGKP